MPLKHKAAIFLIALITLAVELLLIRVLDVIVGTQLEFVLITSAMFALGTAGFCGTLLYTPERTEALIRWSAFGSAMLLLCLRPLFNALPFTYDETMLVSAAQSFYFLGFYLSIFATFFLLGMICVGIFLLSTDAVRTFYFWDLLGAAIGCVAILPFLQSMGPGGLLLWGACGTLLVAAFFTAGAQWRTALVILTIISGIYPLFCSAGNPV